jgi:DNA-binding Lrp family transcriptional regulator
MNNIEVELVKTLLAATKPLTTTELATAAGFPRTTAKYDFKRLNDAGIIKDVGLGGQHGWVLGENAPALDVEIELDNDIEARKAFFAKFFKTFYPDIDPEVNPDLAFLKLVGAYDFVYGESASSVPSSCVPLSCRTWFAIDFVHMEDLDADMQALKNYVLEKVREQM